MIFTDQMRVAIGHAQHSGRPTNFYAGRSGAAQHAMHSPLLEILIPRMFLQNRGKGELMGSLGAELVGTPQRERGGETAQERFDFQALWGMALLLRRYDAEGNYAVIFEFHDDLALINDPDEPDQVQFFQVKTKDKGSWSLAELKRRKVLREKKANDLLDALEPQADEDSSSEVLKKQGPSILGKMFYNVRQFGKSVASVTFVSNAPCDLHQDRVFEFHQCEPSKLALLLEAVQAEYSDATEADIALLGFERTDLSLQDSSVHMKGKLHDFVKRHVGEEEFPLDSLFRLVADECRKRSKFTGNGATMSDVVKVKGITRADVQGWLDTVKAAVRLPSWEELSGQLAYPFAEMLLLRASWGSYRAEALNQADEALRAIRRAIRGRIERGFAADATLTQTIESTFADVEAVGRTHLAPFQPARLRAMIIYELYTKDAA